MEIIFQNSQKYRILNKINYRKFSVILKFIQSENSNCREFFGMIL